MNIKPAFLYSVEKIAAMLPTGPCCDDADDVTTLLMWAHEELGITYREALKVGEALYGLPWCTDDERERLEIAQRIYVAVVEARRE